MLTTASTSKHFQSFSTQDRDVKIEKDHDLMELKTKKEMLILRAFKKKRLFLQVAKHSYPPLYFTVLRPWQDVKC